MTKKTLSVVLAVAAALLVAAACVAPPPMTGAADQSGPAQPAVTAEIPSATEPAIAEAQPADTQARGRGMGMGRGGMMAMHHAAIPAEFASLVNPVAIDDVSLARGATLYEANCVTCHGDTGMGDGLTGANLDPSPAPIAHTSQMLSDGYLFWRITEGGAEFGTAMPTWGDALAPEERWDLINYIRNIGSAPARGRGPGPMAGEGEQRAEMLAAAVEQGVITVEDAAFFDEVHAVLDEHYMQAGTEMQGMGAGSMMTMQRAMTGQAVRDGYISQADSDKFTEIHDSLIEAGVMQ